MYWKTEGVILRETDYKEHDRLLTVLTRDHGPVTMKARGVRGHRSTLKAACQLLAYSEFTVSEQRGYLTITEAVTKEQFPALRQDIELLSLASYFAQVSETIAQEDCPNPELLSLLLNCLYALGPLHKPQPVVKAVFELRAICLAGYLPELSGCFVCGNPMPDRFDLVHGVLQCSGCGPGQGTLVPLSAAARTALHYITACGPKQIFSFTVDDATAEELSQLSEAYLMTQLERGFHTLDFYKSLKR